MLSGNTKVWLLDTLGQSSQMDKFLSGLGVNTENSDSALVAIEKGLSGDSDLRQGAADYLAQIPEGKRAWRIDHDLLKFNGIDPVFAMALLHSFGPYSHTGDFIDDDAEEVRGLFSILPSSSQGYEGRTTLCLVLEDGAWELQVNIVIAANVCWRTDFRGDTNHNGPDILIEEKQIPLTIAAASANKPLAAFMNHPFLDRYPLVASNIRVEEPDIIIDIEGANIAMNLNDLIAAA